MSIPRKMSVACPKCRAAIHFTMWDSINTEMSFAVNQIISGKLFEVTCSKCGFTTLVDYPMLFNDMNHSIMIMYQRQKDYYENSKLDSLVKAFKTNYRIVFSQEALREKVCIINAGYDDRVMELYKVFLLHTDFSEQHPNEIGTAFFYGEDNSNRIDILTDEGKSYNTPFQKNIYDALKESFELCVKAYPVNETVIDSEWAEKYIETVLIPFANGSSRELFPNNTENAKKVAEEVQCIIDELDKAQNTEFVQGIWEIASLRRYYAFLEEIKGNFKSVEDLVTDTRARMLSEEENIPYQEARDRVLFGDHELPLTLDANDSIVKKLLSAFDYVYKALDYPTYGKFCVKCYKKSSIDSNYCKYCGTEFPKK